MKHIMHRGAAQLRKINTGTLIHSFNLLSDSFAALKAIDNKEKYDY